MKIPQCTYTSGTEYRSTPIRFLFCSLQTLFGSLCSNALWLLVLLLLLPLSGFLCCSALLLSGFCSALCGSLRLSAALFRSFWLSKPLCCYLLPFAVICVLWLLDILDAVWYSFILFAVIVFPSVDLCFYYLRFFSNCYSLLLFITIC